MMNLCRWNPNKQVDPFKEFFDMGHDLFGLSLAPASGKSLINQQGLWYPDFDITEDKNTVTVKADLPGLKKEDIDVSLNNNILTIRGERKYENEKKEKNYHRVERAYGAFHRSFDLGSPVDGSKVKARYQEGVLELVLPKTEETKSKQINIE